VFFYKWIYNEKLIYTVKLKNTEISIHEANKYLTMKSASQET
jgi:hypothetical protein